ncbi:hypothetical protein N4T20_02605 [Flavobacterium sp. TR2]|uniref:hypothetical protein n=1 Tax=Flavobacterium sp. TR2 TaxID=2977321 RepID=UPI0021B1366B|nr:hypothetical protein [Flavobacterium sp. TR2]UWY28822.1 hypothetical protein N4T20_02605 [Flavobacterium sp. TR2]
MRTIIILIIALFCMSCKVHIATKFKIVTKERNYYTENITYRNDSIMFAEKCRNGLSKDTLKILYKSVKIIPTN